MNEANEAIPHLREILVFLAVTGLLVPVLIRLRFPSVLGFLTTGVLIGPYGLGLYFHDNPLIDAVTIRDIEGVRGPAELGIVFLLFTIGLELSFQRIWSMRGLVFGFGGLQVVLTAAATGIVAVAMGVPNEGAIILGMSFALSSTAIVMQLLTEQGRIATEVGRASFAILLLQDLAVIPALFAVSALSGGSVNVGLAFLLALLKALAAIGGIVLLGRLVMRPLFRFIGMPGRPEIFMAVTLLIVLGIAWTTSAVGLSMALGAFLAGLLFAETEYRHQIDVDVAPFKGLLLGLFFISVGMGIDLRELARNLWPILASVAGIMCLKAAIIAGLAGVFRLHRAAGIESGLVLSQVSEFAFVIAGIASVSGVLSHELGQFALIVTALTMFAAPVAALIGRRLGRIVARQDLDTGHGEELATLSELKDHVIVAGYGRVGSLLGDVLDSQNVRQIGFDLDALGVARQRASGRQVFYADASRPRILERVNAGAALALVVTMDDPYSVEAVVGAARRAWPNLPIYARARDLEHAGRLVQLGATKAIPENLEASLQLAQQTLEAVGVPTDTAWRLCEILRESETVSEAREPGPVSIAGNAAG